jgi:hypothetical protein
MKRLIKSFLVPILFLISHFVMAQEQVEMADGLRQEGKIYVVVAIMLTLFAGLILYLVILDRKISRVEKKLPRDK